MKNKKYMVMRLNTEIVQIMGYGSEQNIKLGGCAGYIPVFNTLKQAEKNSKGKYPIVPITLTK